MHITFYVKHYKFDKKGFNFMTEQLSIPTLNETTKRDDIIEHIRWLNIRSPDLYILVH